MPARKAEERKLQQRIVAWLHEECAEQPPLRAFVGSANGAYLGGSGKDPGAGARVWASLQSTGCSKGYPDMFFHRRGAKGEIGLAVELKLPGGKLKPEQEWWRDTLVDEGCHYAVVVSFQEFKTTLTDYLHGQPAAPTPVRRTERPLSLRGASAEFALVLE